jgi:Chaperone for flagella basal body P-ring formation
MILAPLLLAAACVAVEGERILISDLAKTVPAFRAAPGEEALGFAPAPGARRILFPREIERLAVRYGVETVPGAGACFELAAAPLSEARVSDALGRIFEGAGVSWKLVEFSRYPVPPGEIEFAAPPAPPGTRPVLVRGRIRYGEGRSYPVWARVEIARPPREVERGDTVAVEVSSGAALLKFEARAESGGRLGETVTLRNPASNKSFPARVAGQGKVTVDAKQNPGSVARSGVRADGR